MTLGDPLDRARERLQLIEDSEGAGLVAGKRRSVAESSERLGGLFGKHHRLFGMAPCLIGGAGLR